MLARLIPIAIALATSFALVGALSCGSPQQVAKAEPEDEDKPKRSNKYGDEEAVSEKGKKWGGWRYQGNREDCFYKVGRKCFDDKQKACKAAGCPGSACTGKSGAPVKIMCKK